MQLLDRALPPVAHLPESWAGRTLPLLRTLGVTSVKPALRDRTAVRYLTPNGRFGVELALARAEGCDEPAGVRLDRAAFDEILVRNAISQGAAFRPLHTVTEIALGAEGAPSTVTCATPQGPAQLRAHYLVDATGKSALVAGQLGTRVASAALDPRQAVFTHFKPEAGHRFAAPDSMTIIGIEHGYVFVIPLDAERVSVGVVVGESAARRHDDDITTLFWTHVDEAACLTDFFAGADQLLPVIPALNAEFQADPVAGDSYALAGDAAAFTDPFFCTGIDLAIETGVEAGRAAAAVLEAPDRPRAPRRPPSTPSGCPRSTARPSAPARSRGSGRERTATC